MREAYIVESVRTAGSKAKKGNFKNMRPDDLATYAVNGLIEKTGIDRDEIEDLILGCAFPEAEQGMNVSRIVVLNAGLPYSVPGQTVNRFCSSGLQAIAIACERIMAGFADLIIAGGTESMTMVPMTGNTFRANPDLVEKWPECYLSMGMTAELVAERYKITREEQDEFAYESHKKAAKAIDEGKFKDEIVPVEVLHKQLVNGKLQTKKELVDLDDGVRRDTSIESLSKLKPAFKKDGTVTAGTSSQMTDGAATSLVVSEDFLKRNNLTPALKFRGFAVKGVPPEIMGIGPIEAIPSALKLAGLSMGDIGLVELNEAFASQSLAIIKTLGLNKDIINVNGGAIALGHPLGCTGAKLTATLKHEMKRRNVKYGMVTMCIGGGMGACGIFENV